MIVAVICIPWMLLAKPFMIHRANKQRQSIGTTGLESGLVEEGEPSTLPAAQPHDQLDMGELCIHQVGSKFF